MESEKRHEEESKFLVDSNIVALYNFENVGAMLDVLKAVDNKEKVNAAVLMEFTFDIPEVVKDLDKVTSFAKENEIDIIMAPDNPFKGKMKWGEIKKEFERENAVIEEIDMPDDFIPVSVGVFVGKDGSSYIFPKTFHFEGHKPIHKIPNRDVAVTICGEIGDITLKDLENLDDVHVLYNPSREGDDPGLQFRFLHQYGEKPLTRDDIANVLVKMGSVPNPDLSDEELQVKIKDDVERYYQNLIKVGVSTTEARRIAQKEDVDVATERAERKGFLDRAVQQAMDEISAKQLNSPYIKKIESILESKNILVVRSDRSTSGILNSLPNLKVDNIKCERDYMVFHANLINTNI